MLSKSLATQRDGHEEMLMVRRMYDSVSVKAGTRHLKRRIWKAHDDTMWIYVNGTYMEVSKDADGYKETGREAHEKEVAL